jgi:hypothetical protein
MGEVAYRFETGSKFKRKEEITCRVEIEQVLLEQAP